ncbi:MAG: hypothetical protein JNM36_11500, partial [Chitinophagales bacterium]|nr:hypothetical protein [Chitinophagales bacterium]
LNNYYPYGMLQSARSVSTGDYRFGFNGMEQTKGVQGNGQGNFYDYKNRDYDSWKIRFNRTDALESKYPFYSPYQFAGNKPIANVDLDGNEDLYYTLSFNEKTGKSQLTLTKEVDGTLCNCFGAHLYIHYKGNTYYQGSFPTSSAGQWFVNDFLAAPTLNETLATYTGLSEKQADSEFANKQPVGAMREQSSQEHEAELSQLFTDAFVYAYAANRAGTADAKKQIKVVTQSNQSNASQASTTILKPLGLGSTGRTTAKNLTEQLTMQEIMSNPTMGAMVNLKKGMGDARWTSADRWQKMAWRDHGVVIHYFKFKDQGQKP